ncbi:MAG: phosphoribosylformylglycinamidine synthase subunit PurL [bacterium]|nr:phosphoribosylformylglycinamidine synthase subunit PurL [bacterium]
MLQIVRVTTISETNDLVGKSVFAEAQKILKNDSLQKVRTTRVYRLEGVRIKEAKILAEKLFCENINQVYTLNRSALATPSSVFEIAYKPGVMNPEVASIIKAAKDLEISLIACDSSKEYVFYGKIGKDDIEHIVQKLNLLNPTIEYSVKTPPKTLLIKGAVGKTLTIPIRTMTDSQLLDLSKDKLFLNLEEIKVIQHYFQKIKRDPTDCELETLAQTWSEHCAHKTFKASLTVDGKRKKPLITRIKKEALKHKKDIVSAFVDNSGVMDFYDNWAVCGKVETHNSPSAIEPYGGAATGSGGVFRDILGTGRGAKTIVSTDIFCFAPPNMKLSKLPSGCLPPDYLLKQVVAGVRDYGNRMGIPTNNGSLHFHDDFRAKPTVIVGGYGILPKTKARKGKPKIGDIVVAVGGRTGRDGIHGATFSSAEMTDKTVNIHSSSVQIGNAIEEKRMFDAILEARDKNLIRAIQDCGAGGFSSAIGEMGEKTGVAVRLEKAPLKYQGLAPWEIWISESQERMVLAIQKNKLKAFISICKKYNVEATVLGKFDGSKKLNVHYKKEKVCDLNMQFLHHGLPQRTMIAKKLIPSEEPMLSPRRWPNGLLRGGPRTEKAWINILKKVLSHGNVCSKEPIVRLYDHSVQGTNNLQPFTGERLDGPNDAVVIRPLLNRPYGMIVSHGLNPVLNKIDPYWGSIWAAVEAISNYVAVGGNYKNASLINNYIWPFPDEESLWSLDKSVDAVVDFMKTLRIPVISGKDSLSSTYRAKDGTVIKIPPVLCISVFGKIPDVSKTISSDFKKEGSIICLVGKMDYERMGGSVYYQACHSDPERSEGKESQIPHIDLNLLPKVLNTIHREIQSRKILSCHDISEGGLITAIFEMCVGGNMGIIIATPTSDGGRPSLRGHDSSEVNFRSDFFLFNETAGCFLVEVENEKVAKKLFQEVPFLIIGKTVRQLTIAVQHNKKQLFSVGVEPLKRAWQEPMRRIFR